MNQILNRRRFAGVGSVFFLGFALVMIGACRDDETVISHRTIPGTIEQIDLTRRHVTLKYLHEKSGQYREIEGSVPADAEIFINGKLSTLADIRVGEHAVVSGRIEKKENDRNVSALRIDITRDETVRFNTSSADPEG